MMNTKLALCAIPAIASVIAASDALAAPSLCDTVAGNLVQNCGFESGGADWTNGNPIAVAVFVHSGTVAYQYFSAFLSNAVVQQTITTTIGDTYSFDFYVDAIMPSSASFGSDFHALPRSGSYQEYHFNEVATSSSTLLSFTGDGILDDVSVVDITPASSPVPKPVSLAVLGAGLAGLVGARRRAA